MWWWDMFFWRNSRQLRRQIDDKTMLLLVFTLSFIQHKKSVRHIILTRSCKTATHQFTFPNTVVTFQWIEIMTCCQYHSTGGGPFTLNVFHSTNTDLTSCFWMACDLFSSPFVFIWGRIVELFSPGPISPHWGVLSKCLAYSKAASDPFVYSLLRHQYRKTCNLLANKVLKRSPLNSSSLRTENTQRGAATTLTQPKTSSSRLTCAWRCNIRVNC